MIRIEVVHALRDVQVVVELELEEGATALDALVRSRIPERVAGIDVSSPLLGIFGRVVPGNTPLRDGDRVELYRPLEADPSVARRARVRRRPASRA